MNGAVGGHMYGAVGRHMNLVAGIQHAMQAGQVEGELAASRESGWLAHGRVDSRPAGELIPGLRAS